MNNKVRWKTANAATCQEDCWCKGIVVESATDEEIADINLEDKIWIIGTALLSKEEAEYFVKLHNARLI